MGKVLGIIYLAISTHLIHKAGLQLNDGATGAVTLIKRIIRSSGGEPRKIVTDKLRSYGVARPELIPEAIHITHQYANHRVEQSHESTRLGERGLRQDAALSGSGQVNLSKPMQALFGWRASHQMNRIAAILALVFGLFLVLAETARNWGNWQWWPYWVVDFIAAALRFAGATLVLRGARGGSATLCGAWSFTTAMFHSSF